MSDAGKNQTVKIVLAILFLGIAGAIALRPKPRPQAGGQYFYDLQDKKLYNEKSGVEAPVKAPSGGEGVLAAVYACGSCDNEADHFIAYLSRNSDTYMAALASREPIPAEVSRQGTLVRATNGSEWFPAPSPQGMQLTESLRTRCPGKEAAVSCQP